MSLKRCVSWRGRVTGARKGVRVGQTRLGGLGRVTTRQDVPLSRGGRKRKTENECVIRLTLFTYFRRNSESQTELQNLYPRIRGRSTKGKPRRLIKPSTPVTYRSRLRSFSSGESFRFFQVSTWGNGDNKLDSDKEMERRMEVWSIRVLTLFFIVNRKCDVKYFV